MGIDTDLNIDPYFDDFDDTKQFNRILFKPAVALQARELTQLQTILQKQVERFGSNIFKEGTIISGCNISLRNDLQYVKISDQSDFITFVNEVVEDDISYTLRGETSGLNAEVIFAVNGFETKVPDLKTVFIKYLDTDVATGAKQFISGESVTVLDSDENVVYSFTVSSVANHVGKSAGVSIEEGIIYQKGHFIFVEAQFVIVSKYNNEPDGVSVGFVVQENIITSNQDSSLLDNAQGFNNLNAPGADRLQLKPILTAIATASEPETFFAIIRYNNGNATQIRDVTQFNSIATELARRTYEESGNYVVRGLNTKVEAYVDGANTNYYATVEPGKAFVLGYEVKNVGKLYFPLEGSEITVSKANQSIGVQYGGYYEYDYTNGGTLNAFELDGARYDLKDAGGSVIGKCSIKNVEQGKIYVYAVEKNSGEENTSVAKIADTTLSSNTATNLIEPFNTELIFDTGKLTMKDVTNLSFTKRIKEAISPAATTFTISATANVKPLTSNIVVLDGTSNIITFTSATYDGEDVDISGLSASDAAFVYYDAIVDNYQEDSLEELDVYLYTTLSNGEASLGIPNCIRLLEVKEVTSGTTVGDDVTSKLKLIVNQKPGFYDLSRIRLKVGESLAYSTVRVKVKALRRTSLYGSGYLTANSYDGVNKKILPFYPAPSGKVYNLVNSIDFRPYANPVVPYSLGIAGAGTVSVSAVTIVSGVNPIANSSRILMDQEFYSPRIDNIVIDSAGSFQLVKGIPSENPSRPVVGNAFPITEIFIPGNELSVSSDNPIRVKKISTKGYTMKDIEYIDTKIDRLTEIVSLSLLENQTKDYFIPDAQGLNRFKNGILVDQFKDSNIADLTNTQFRSGIDPSYTVGTPAFKSFPINLKYSSGSNIDSGYSDVVSISNTGTQRIIDQPYATRFRKLVTNGFNYKGSAFIYPQFDSNYNVVSAPAINVDIDKSATNNLSLIDTLLEYIPLTQSTSKLKRSSYGSSIYEVTTTTTDVDIQRREAVTEKVGDFVTDVRIKPYMQAKRIKVLVSGLRPNTRHYFYFAKRAVNDYVYPGSLSSATQSANLVQVNGVAGSAVTSNSNGLLLAVFDVPSNQFFVGENELEIVDVNTYSSISSAQTSYAKVTYYAYNYDLEKTSINYTTRPVEFDVNSTTTTTDNVVRNEIDDSNENEGRGPEGYD
jgi:hypothetical protein